MVDTRQAFNDHQLGHVAELTIKLLVDLLHRKVCWLICCKGRYVGWVVVQVDLITKAYSMFIIHFQRP